MKLFLILSCLSLVTTMVESAIFVKIPSIPGESKPTNGIGTNSTEGTIRVSGRGKRNVIRVRTKSANRGGGTGSGLGSEARLLNFTKRIDQTTPLLAIAAFGGGGNIRDAWVCDTMEREIHSDDALLPTDCELLMHLQQVQVVAHTLGQSSDDQPVATEEFTLQFNKYALIYKPGTDIEVGRGWNFRKNSVWTDFNVGDPGRKV